MLCSCLSENYLSLLIGIFREYRDYDCQYDCVHKWQKCKEHHDNDIVWAMHNKNAWKCRENDVTWVIPVSCLHFLFYKQQTETVDDRQRPDVQQDLRTLDVQGPRCCWQNLHTLTHAATSSVSTVLCWKNQWSYASLWCVHNACGIVAPSNSASNRSTSWESGGNRRNILR